MDNGTITFEKDLVEIGVTAEHKEDVIRILSDRLLAAGYVKDTYYDNVLKREEVFPTGLPTVIPIAICHTESEHVNQTAVAVATLVNPVHFQEMGTPERDVWAEIVFAIAMKDPKNQVPFLGKMMTLFQDEETLSTIRSATDGQALVDFLNSVFTEA